MTSTSALPRWESRNGYVPPPRFQQLRAQEALNQQLQRNQAPQFQRNRIGSPQHQDQAPLSADQMAHARSPSFFGFGRNKSTPDSQPRNLLRAPSLSSSPQNTRNKSPIPNGAPQNVLLNRPNPTQQQQPQSMTPQSSTQQQVNLHTVPAASSSIPRQTPPLTRSPSISQPPTNTTPAAPVAGIHSEIRSVIQLTVAHAHKVYFSGPLTRRIERQADGQRPTKDEGWTDIWAQLGGTTLSIWLTKEIEEANRHGREVPPAYINVTDAFIQVLGSVTVPATTTTPSKRYTNVVTLNTAGSNLILFSCPSATALISWATAFRLAAWEKSRLEEIYTAHLIRITLNARDVPSTLVQGRMEGWARVRIAGQTDWKRVWILVQEGFDGADNVPQPSPGQTLNKKRRVSNLFSREASYNQSVPAKPMISMFTSPKAKDRKKPLLTMHSVTQAFGVYPERPELINRSTLIKIEGKFGDDDLAGPHRIREGWVLIMPELETISGQVAEMLKWVVALHDAFELYGRPEAWTWDPRDPVSLMFGYPVGQQRERLFLDLDVADKMDPREDSTSGIRSKLKGFLNDSMRPPVLAVKGTTSDKKIEPLPLTEGLTASSNNNDPLAKLHQLPPLNFSNNGEGTSRSEPRPLTPIKERNTPSTVHAGSLDNSPWNPTGNLDSSILNDQLTSSPPLTSHLSQGSIVLPLENPHEMPDSSTTPTLSTIPSTVPSLNSEGEKSLTSFATSVVDTPNLQDLISRPPPLTPQQQFTVNQPISPVRSASISQLSNSSLPFPVSVLEKVRLETRPSYNPPDIPSQGPLIRKEEVVPTLETSSQPSPSPVPATPDKPSPPTDADDFIHEAGALYYMQQQSDSGTSGGVLKLQAQPVRQNTEPEIENESDESSIEDPRRRPTINTAAVNAPILIQQVRSPVSPGSLPVRRGTPMAFVNNNDDVDTTADVSHPRKPTSAVHPILPADRLSPTRHGLGRKPSGARAREKPTTFKHNVNASISSQTVTEVDEEMHSSKHLKQESDTYAVAFDDSHGEALAALNYLDIADNEVMAKSSSSSLQSKPQPQDLTPVEPLHVYTSDRLLASSPQPLTGSSEGLQYKSSFAPSTKAAERKLKAQAQQAAKHAAAHKPGRANGKRKGNIAGGAWESSEDDDDQDDDDDEDDDGDIDSDPQRPVSRGPQSVSSHHGPSSSVHTSRPGLAQLSSVDVGSDMVPPPSHLRPPRNLPQIPGNRGSLADEVYHPQPHPIPRRLGSDPYSEANKRSYYEDGTPIRTQAEFPQPGAARQNVWSQVLDPGRTPGRAPQPESQSQPVRDTFVQLEPSETMTKAFTPQGLLSAGLQDKVDRSARRQEELARESGASLINVPNKPPPPQTGLLGAITAHERERKREGGVGAALTEREREKRVAEERQRRFDDQQRQQLDQLQQGGSAYGGQFGGYNPMMANPMMMGMMGMNPMMTGGGMAPMNPMMTGQMYPGMMGNFNPHVFAAQQAAQAYQQAMMAFSVAGSQVGGEGANGPSQPNPTMTGMGPGGMNPTMTGMTGFDPRMSMMGMPMMGMGMGNMGMGMGNMGMGMGNLANPPMGMQMTGMSNFDPRSSPGIPDAVPMDNGSLMPPTPTAQLSSRTSSPAPRGSPLARLPPETSRPTSPNPK